MPRLRFDCFEYLTRRTDFPCWPNLQLSAHCQARDNGQNNISVRALAAYERVKILHLPVTQMCYDICRKVLGRKTRFRGLDWPPVMFVSSPTGHAARFGIQVIINTFDGQISTWQTYRLHFTSRTSSRATRSDDDVLKSNDSSPNLKSNQTP